MERGNKVPFNLKLGIHILDLTAADTASGTGYIQYRVHAI